ncbi:MAG: PaREP1 family protein [Candidatus Caldarchaeales archaeon]
MGSSEVSEEVFALVTVVAKRKGKTVDGLILEYVAKDVDPGVRIEVYMKLHERYLREAEELYASGDLTQAGEKYWGAVTALINAIAERRGWSYYSHRDYAEVIERLSEELKEPLGRLFASVERLHANYYHNFLTKVNFDAHREDAIKLMQLLKAIS